MNKSLGIGFLALALFSAAIWLTIFFFSENKNAEMAQKNWWDDAVFYEIYVRSFHDSNGDGVGDFNGITQKLDYLQDLGVTAIWLMPIHPATSDHGYDVTDYKAVSPDYGSLEDFKKLLNEAHKRNMRIIIDFVANHTSDKHPFFLSANADINSPYRNWYVWSETKKAMNWYPGNRGYYYSVFSKSLPDLNYRNPQVVQYVKDVMKHWLGDVGVDGFRLDAVKYFVEQNDQYEDAVANHDLLESLHHFTQENYPLAYTVGEVADARSTISAEYVGQFTNSFNFELADSFVASALSGKKDAVEQAYSSLLKSLPNGTYATFLSSHDHDRILSLMQGNKDKARVAASLLLTAPGTPFIYYGDEMGMLGRNADQTNRSPMQSFNPVGTAVLWNHYRELIRLRKETLALHAGGATVVTTDSEAIFSLLRVKNAEQVLVIINLGENEMANYQLSLNTSLLEKGEYAFKGLFGNIDGTVMVDELGGFSIDITAPIKPYQTLIIEMIKKKN